MMISARRSFIALGSFLAAMGFCAGFAYAACNAAASHPQATTYRGLRVTEGYGRNDGGRHSSPVHRAIDVATSDSTFQPFFGGTVTAFSEGNCGNGATVTNANVRATYCHAAQPIVGGRTITTNDTLGNWNGTSGNSTGNHVHLTLSVKDSSGNWVKVDAIEVERLMNQGMNPGDPGFAQAAMDATLARCDSPLASGNGGAGAARRANQYRAICDPRIRARVSAQIDSSVAKLNDYVTTSYTPPPTLAQISNNPCMSRELGRISNQFAYAPTKYAQQLTGNALSAAGPVAGIMQNLFKAQFNSINSAAASIGSMMNFQNLASQALGSLMGSLGLGSAFSSEVCGLMVDMLLKYIQCENPIKLPNLGNIKFSLNNLIPNNCAGAALRSGLYEAGNMSSLQTMSQQIAVEPGGTFSLTPNEQSYDDALGADDDDY